MVHILLGHADSQLLCIKKMDYINVYVQITPKVIFVKGKGKFPCSVILKKTGLMKHNIYILEMHSVMSQVMLEDYSYTNSVAVYSAVRIHLSEQERCGNLP